VQYNLNNISDNRKLLYAWFEAMFTRIDILIYDDDTRDDLPRIAEKIKDEINRIELLTNRFNPESEISCINKTAFNEEMLVSSEFFVLLSECQLYNIQTLGYFDITVNSLNNFRFGAINIFLNVESQAIKFLHSDVQLDLSGYIKGYSLRYIKELLKNENINNALINMGNSSILAMGNHPYGRGWKLSQPESNSTSECILFDECLTTSGNKEQTQWPVIHPINGKAIEKSVEFSVITADPAIGEVLSTALYVAEQEEKEMLLSLYNAKEIKW